MNGMLNNSPIKPDDYISLFNVYDDQKPFYSDDKTEMYFELLGRAYDLSGWSGDKKHCIKDEILKIESGEFLEERLQMHPILKKFIEMDFTPPEKGKNNHSETCLQKCGQVATIDEAAYMKALPGLLRGQAIKDGNFTAEFSEYTFEFEECINQNIEQNKYFSSDKETEDKKINVIDEVQNTTPVKIPESGKLTKKDKNFNLIMDNVKLFSDDNDGYAAYEIGGQKLTDKITSKNFKRYVRKVSRDFNLSITDNQLKEVISELDSEAIFSGVKGNVYNRVGRDEAGNIIINPCFENGNIIYVTSEGWQIIPPMTQLKELNSHTPIIVKTKGMLSLPFPVRGKGNIHDLKKFIRAENDDNKFILTVAYIVQCFFYEGPFPILVIVAEPGSGKTFTTLIIKKIIDPHEAPTLSIPRDPRDMFSTAGVSWVLGYDNFSKVQQWLSDLFCRFSTGNATIDRELFTNGEAYIYSAKRPAIVNGINDFFSQSDVLQRCIIFENNRIRPEERKNESDLLKEFEELSPGIFHDILDLLSTVLKTLPDIEVEAPSRMADFCKIGTAVAVAMGFDEDFFMTAYRENQKQANDITLEASVITPVLKEFLNQKKTFKGTPTELLDALEAINGDHKHSAYWPKTATVLSGNLKRLAQNFRDTGIVINTGRDYNGRWIEVKFDK